MENLLFSAKGDEKKKKKIVYLKTEVLNVLWLPQNTHMNFIKIFFTEQFFWNIKC